MNKDEIKKFVLQHKGAVLKGAICIVVLLLAVFFWMTRDAGDGGVALVQDENVTKAVIEAEAEKEGIENEKPETIIVDVGGAVKNPCVVTLPEGSRVINGVEKAGGLSDEADADAVNLAAKLSDGDKVLIPCKSDQSGPAFSGGIVTQSINGPQNSSQATSGGRVSINRATSDELQTLPGVGPATAQKILDYRQSFGDFNVVEDLMNVSGIGEKTFAKMKDKITL